MSEIQIILNLIFVGLCAYTLKLPGLFGSIVGVICYMYLHNIGVL